MNALVTVLSWRKRSIAFRIELQVSYVMKFRNSLSLLIVLGSLFQFSCSRAVPSQKVFALPGATLPLASFDVPAANSTIKGKTLFGGWGAHSSGIALVAIYLDGNYLISSTIGTDRPDVLKAFPQFKPEMITGWNLYMDPTSWAPGPHQVVAKIIAKSGIDREVSVNLTVAR